MCGRSIDRGRARRVAQLAQEHGLAVSVLVLAYLIAQPFATFPLSGCSNMGQLEENLQAGEIVLDPATLHYLARGA
ncbi:MAG TPA: aldo/keto reductase [Herpetosiphonaceae bacterium]|nr:aldo/keto reductase [Herpetosiphonaceae bacterium]